MANPPGITSIKSFNYRGAIEEWGNTYAFLGDPPADLTAWEGLASALFTMEKAVLPPNVTIVRAYTYDDVNADPQHASFTLDTGEAGLPVTGTETVGGGGTLAPGDSAAWVRWKTDRTNTHGKPIYLRKYYHGVIVVAADSDGDTIYSDQVTKYRALGTALNTASGAWPGLCGPDGVAPGASTSSSYATTRTLRRRGRRPS